METKENLIKSLKNLERWGKVLKVLTALLLVVLGCFALDTLATKAVAQDNLLVGILVGMSCFVILVLLVAVIGELLARVFNIDMRDDDEKECECGQNTKCKCK
jgi:hypothetical protein